MNKEIGKFYNPTQSYPEIARSAFKSFHSAESKETLQKKHPQKIAKALFAISLTSVIYSYMAIE